MKLRRESSFKKDMHRTMIRIIKLLKTAKENYGLRKKRKYNKMDNTSKNMTSKVTTLALIATSNKIIIFNSLLLLFILFY